MKPVAIYGRNHFYYRTRSYSKPAGRGGTKPLSSTQPHTEKSRSVKTGDRGGQVIVPPRPTGTQLHDDLQDF
jgi:hypothetical protein